MDKNLSGPLLCLQSPARGLDHWEMLKNSLFDECGTEKSCLFL